MTALQLPQTTSHLTRLASGLLVPTTSGRRTFASVGKKMFTGFFDPDFVNYETNVPSEDTAPTSADVYEQMKNGDFRKILGSFGGDLAPLFWRSQDAILTTIETHENALNLKEYWSFFPFIVGERRFVAYVSRDGGRFEAFVGHFEGDYEWNAEYRYRFVFPQQTA